MLSKTREKNVLCWTTYQKTILLHLAWLCSKGVTVSAIENNDSPYMYLGTCEHELSFVAIPVSLKK